MVVVALVGRVSLDRARIVSLNRELALHDAVERQRSRVAQRQLELDAMIKQAWPQAELQYLYRWIGTSRSQKNRRVEVTPSAIGLRRQMTTIRGAELRLKMEQAILDEEEKKLRSKVDNRTPKA